MFIRSIMKTDFHKVHELNHCSFFTIFLNCGVMLAASAQNSIGFSHTKLDQALNIRSSKSNKLVIPGPISFRISLQMEDRGFRSFRSEHHCSSVKTSAFAWSQLTNRLRYTSGISLINLTGRTPVRAKKIRQRLE